MSIQPYRYVLVIISFFALLAASCTVTQNYQAPDVSTGGLFRDYTSSDTNTIASLHWNEVFTDTALQTLIQEGIANNPDLKIAYTRIQQAEAYYAQSRAAFLPSLNANASVSAAKLTDIQGQGDKTGATQYQLGLSAGWETNLWGNLSSARRAQLASLLQSQAYSRTVQTGLIAGIANYYYSLLALDRQLAITELTVHNWDTTVQTMRALKEAAVVTGAAVVQSEASRYGAEVTIPDLKQNIREIENALSILLARLPAR